MQSIYNLPFFTKLQLKTATIEHIQHKTLINKNLFKKLLQNVKAIILKVFSVLFQQASANTQIHK